MAEAVRDNPAARQWLESLERLGRSRHTVRQHERCLRRFFAFLTEEAQAGPDQVDFASLVEVYCDGAFMGKGPVSRHLLERFLLWAALPVSDREQAAHLRNDLLQTLRMFFRHLVASEVLCLDPTRGIETAKVRVKVNHRKYLTPAESTSLLEAAASSGSHRARNLTLVATLLRAGLRPGELCNLRVQDLDFAANLVHVTGKTGFRSAPMVPALRDVLHRYVQSDYFQRHCAPKGLLFPDSKGANPITPGELCETLQELCAAAGIDRGVSTYWTRHTFATDAHRSGVTLPIISQALGHAKLGTTHTYVHVREGRMRALAERGAAAIPLLDLRRSLLHIVPSRKRSGTP